MQLILVEDALHRRFRPLTWLRPIFEVLCGRYSAAERLRQLAREIPVSYLLQTGQQAAFAEQYPSAHVVTDLASLPADALLINGRWLATNSGWQQVRQLKHNEMAVSGTDWVAVHASELPLDVSAKDPCESISAAIAQARTQLTSTPVDGLVVQHPWELVEQNPQQLEHDYSIGSRPAPRALSDPRIAVLGDPQLVAVAEGAELDPFVVLDARQGPIVIEAGARVQAFTRLEGPCFIGQQSQLFRANLRGGCSIGPVCRVGGEIENSILQGYSNKYHDGFLGHAFICPWVNLGANTINSDLKNDYSTVKLMVDQEMVDSGSTKVGCFIGDHTKTALASLFNTGSNVGVMSLILPGGELLPKHIPSFSRIWHGLIDEIPCGLDSGIAIARIAMSRRNCELKPAAEALIRDVFAQTTAERERAIERQRSRR